MSFAYQCLAVSMQVIIVIALLCIATHAHKFYSCYDYDMTHAVSLTHIHSDDSLCINMQRVQITLHSDDSHQDVVGIDLYEGNKLYDTGLEHNNCINV